MPIVFLTEDRRPMESLPPEELAAWRQRLTQDYWRLLYAEAADQLRAVQPAKGGDRDAG